MSDLWNAYMSWQHVMTYEQFSGLMISIGIVLLFLVLRRLFTKYIFKFLIYVSKKARSTFFHHLFQAFEKPIQWLFILIGVKIAIHYFPYIDASNPIFLRLLRSGIVVIIAWGLFNFSSVTSILFSKINEKTNFNIDRILIPFLSKAIRVIIVLISITIIAQEFDYDVNGFVAGLGLGGLAFALAAQDALKNLFGGIVIITEKPFSIGDWILTPSVEGVVEDISFRSTRVRTFAQALVTVPNSTLANESITNWSKMGKRQITFHLRVAINTPSDRLKAVVDKIKSMLQNDPEVHKETIFVSFDRYNENGFEIFLYFFTNTTIWGEYLRVKEKINFKIMEILESEGVYLALPSRKLYGDPEAIPPLKKN